MTNQQAINILNGLEQSLDDYCELNDEGKAAFRMAIMALESFGNSEQLPSAQPDATDINVGTTIYRQAAIEAMCGACSDWCDEGVCKKVSAIQKLQSARPIGVQEAYYRGKIDGIKECTARLKKVNEEFENERSYQQTGGD